MRNYKRHTERDKTTIANCERAAIEVNSGGCNLRKAQKLFNINRMSFLVCMGKKKRTNMEGNIEMECKKTSMAFKTK